MKTRTNDCICSLQIEREVTEFFAGKNGVGILLDVLKHPKPHAELSSLALQYFLHIAADHAEFLDGAMKTQFETSILPQLVGNELAKELLVETYHRYDSLLCCSDVPRQPLHADDLFYIVLAGQKCFPTSLSLW